MTEISQRQLTHLDDFLTEAFTSFELHRLLAQTYGQKLVAELPSPGQSPRSFAFDAVRLLERLGLINTKLFLSLERARPERHAELRQLAARIDLDGGDRLEAETTAWRPVDTFDQRRRSWVEALEDLTLDRERSSHDDDRRADIDRRIDLLTRHLRGIPHVGAGSVVAGARLERHLGSGNFGSVWRARHLSSGSIVAAKIFNLDKLAEGIMLWRFRRSIRALETLSKSRGAPRSLCTIVDVSGDTLAFCMPYLPGGTLEQVERRGWSLATKVAVFIEICRAVAFAHESGVIHRDIKPANILLDAEFKPVLIDFDVADIRFVTELDLAEGGIGTPTFAAPEQLENADTADERSDIYSLGRLLHYLLLERSPGLQTEKDPQLGNLRAFPPALVMAVRKATQSDPRRRHSCVQNLILDVQSYMTGYAAARARLGNGWRWVRRNASLMASASTVLGASLSLNYIQNARIDEWYRSNAELRKLNEALDKLTDQSETNAEEHHRQLIQSMKLTSAVHACIRDGSCTEEHAERLEVLQRAMLVTSSTFNHTLRRMADERQRISERLEANASHGPGYTPATHVPNPLAARVLSPSSAEPESHLQTHDLSPSAPPPTVRPSDQAVLTSSVSDVVERFATPPPSQPAPTSSPTPRQRHKKREDITPGLIEFERTMDGAYMDLLGEIKKDPYNRPDEIRISALLDREGGFEKLHITPSLSQNVERAIKNHVRRLNFPEICWGDAYEYKLAFK